MKSGKREIPITNRELIFLFFFFEEPFQHESRITCQPKKQKIHKSKGGGLSSNFGLKRYISCYHSISLDIRLLFICCTTFNTQTIKKSVSFMIVDAMAR